MGDYWQWISIVLAFVFGGLQVLGVVNESVGYLMLAVALVIFSAATEQKMKGKPRKDVNRTPNSPDMKKLSLAKGYAVSPPRGEKGQTWHFTVNNETGIDLKDCYLILEKSYRRWTENDDWENEQDKLVTEPFKWDANEVSKNGRLDIADGDRESFTLGESNEYSAYHVQEKRNVTYSEFGLSLHDGGGMIGGNLEMGWFYRLVIALRSKNQKGEKLPDLIYNFYIQPIESAGPAGGVRIQGVTRKG